MDILPRSDSGCMDAICDRFRAADDPITLRKETFIERQQVLWREKALDLQSYLQSIKLDLNSTTDVGLLHLTITVILIPLHFPIVSKKLRFDLVALIGRC